MSHYPTRTPGGEGGRTTSHHPTENHTLARAERVDAQRPGEGIFALLLFPASLFTSRHGAMCDRVDYNIANGDRHRAVCRAPWRSPLVADMKYDLERFVKAQNPVYAEACRELQQGLKQGHWMWFIFPQLKGLGHSSMANRYGISSVVEARAYLAHPVLGPRLAECTSLANSVEGVSVEDIFGFSDTMKFRSSMTLFAHVSSGSNVFADALQKYYSGQPDPLTLEMLSS